MPFWTYEALSIGFQTVSQGTHEALDAGSDYIAWNA